MLEAPILTEWRHANPSFIDDVTGNFKGFVIVGAYDGFAGQR